jgi:hypothetical protein
MDELALALEKLRSANMLTAKDRALEFATEAEKRLEMNKTTIRRLIDDVIVNGEELYAVKTRLEILERRQGILTHG